MNSTPLTTANGCLLVTTDLPTIAMGLYHIAHTLKKNHIPCEIHLFEDTGTLFELISSRSIDIIGFSVHWHSQIIPSIKLAEQIKGAFPEKIIVLGGLTASYFAKDLITFQQVDYLVAGDGELPFLQIAQGHPPASIPNLFWKSEGGAVHANQVRYETSAAELTTFVYENAKDFQQTRFILKMGKGCFHGCFHCGGGRDVFEEHRICRPVALAPTEIAQVIEKNFTHLKFKHLYLAQDHYRDLKNIAQGLLSLPKNITDAFDVTLSAWGIPDKDTIKKVCQRFGNVCLELTFDSMDEIILRNSRKCPFANRSFLDEIIAYLQELFETPNLQIIIFFSYPHLYGGKMLFPDYQTLQAIFLLEDHFRREHLEGRLGICYLLLSTDPGSQYGKEFSFKTFWTNMLQMPSGFGSFCFHYRPFMNDDEFRTHHLFIQMLMKIFELSTNLIQYIYQVTFQANTEHFYDTFLKVFKSLYDEEIADELSIAQSYFHGHSYLGYSCVKQEAISEPQLTNFIFRFLNRCFKNHLIEQPFHFMTRIFHSQSRLAEAAYRSCLETSATNNNEKIAQERLYPLRNPLICICRQVEHVHLSLACQLYRAGSVFQYRREEALAAFWEKFSLKTFSAAAQRTHWQQFQSDSAIHLEALLAEKNGPLANDESFAANKTEPDIVFDWLYHLSKAYHPKFNRFYEPIGTYLTVVSGQKALAESWQALHQNKLPDNLQTGTATYAVTEQSQRLIPLTDEETWILERCDGLISMKQLKQTWLDQYGLSETVFKTMVRFFYAEHLIV